RAALHGELTKQGVRIHPRTTIERVEKKGDEYHATLSDGRVLVADQVMAAVGRRPNTEGLGLEAVGVTVGPRGAVVVDAGFRSSVPSIWAVGDVIERVQLTPVAIAEGTALARRL